MHQDASRGLGDFSSGERHRTFPNNPAFAHGYVSIGQLSAPYSHIYPAGMTGASFRRADLPLTPAPTIRSQVAAGRSAKYPFCCGPNVMLYKRLRAAPCWRAPAGLLMYTGYVDSSDHHCIIGWAADTDRPDSRLELSIRVNGAEQGRVVADQPREGLRQHGAYGDGAHAFTYVFDPPLSPLHAYDIVVRYVDTPADVPEGRFRIEPIESGDLTLRPVLVTATGRSGTTLLMRRLGNAREVAIADLYPFEMKLLTYYGHALETLTTASSPRSPTTLDELTTDPYHLGLNPFHHFQMEKVYSNRTQLYEFFGRRATARLRPAFRDIIDDFYHDMQIHTRKPRARFFAEKCDVFTSARNFARLAFDGVKEILLVRDPRDVHCSRRAFWSDSAESSFQNLKTVQAAILPIHRAYLGDLHVVRYEDLIQNPTETLSGVSTYLGLVHPIELNPGSERKIFSSHGTSPDPASSIGRWKHELSAEERTAFSQAFKPFLETFGYDPDAG